MSPPLKSKKYHELFIENFNGIIIGQGLLRNAKKRDVGPKISPSLSSKGDRLSLLKAFQH
jgi:hypothetical protein